MPFPVLNQLSTITKNIWMQIWWLPLCVHSKQLDFFLPRKYRKWSQILVSWKRYQISLSLLQLIWQPWEMNFQSICSFWRCCSWMWYTRFLENHSSPLPVWAEAVQKVILVQPSSAQQKEFFQLWRIVFGTDSWALWKITWRHHWCSLIVAKD